MEDEYEKIGKRYANSLEESMQKTIEDTWVGLTEIEFSEIFNEWEDTKGTSYWNLYERIELTLREKNT